MTVSPTSATASASLWRHRDFRRYLTGQTASVAGSSITSMALPVLAVLELGATTGQVAWLAFLGQLPPALLALHAGALADRHSKRRQMITGDLVSAAALATVPLAAALGVLTLTQLMVVAAVQGAAGVLHDAAAISLLPKLVEKSLIQRSNSRIGSLIAIAATGGSNAGAALTALLGPARALLGDVASYLLSAWCTARIQTDETCPTRAEKRRLRTEIAEGLRYVHADRRLSVLTWVNATTSLALAVLNTLWALYLLRVLQLSATAFGLVLGIGALGAAAGAFAAPALTRQCGPGPMMLGAVALTPLTQLPLLLASPGLGWEITIGAALFLQLACAGAAGTTQRSIRQIITEYRMQARMQAVSTCLTSGARPLGALMAGGLGTWAGVRPALAVGACLLVVPLVILATSPLRALRHMPNPPPEPDDPKDSTAHALPEPRTATQSAGSQLPAAAAPRTALVNHSHKGGHPDSGPHPGAGEESSPRPKPGTARSDTPYSSASPNCEATLPPTRAHIQDVVTAYLERHPAEAPLLATLLQLLDEDAEPTSRSTMPGHITCSAVVVDHSSRVLLIHHNTFGLLLAPGGHVEAGDRSLLGTALREVHEEAGIPPGALCATAAYGDLPIDIDVFDIDANPAKGEAAHQHWDFRFVFQLVDRDVKITVQPEEVSAPQWVAFDKVTAPQLREKLTESGLDGCIEPVNASALIHDGHGRYLLHLRDDLPGIWEPGAWALLGGGREPGDTSLEDTVRRELREEAGLEPGVVEPFAVELATGTDGRTLPVAVFTAQWNDDPARLPLTEGVMLAWFHPDAMARLRLSPSTLDLVRRHAEHSGRAQAASQREALGPDLPKSGSTSVPHIVGVHLYLERDGRVLLGLRHPDSAYAGGTHHFLAGHCEQESAVACLVREAEEEAGLLIDPQDVELAHVVHMVDEPGAQPRIGFVFRARHWTGTPEVLEPDRCVAWDWWPTDALPEPIVAYTRAAIEGIRAGRPYTELGWT
ncbi:MFS transporter [Streptomyces nojiriensis]|uniref:MFS transporter n=1 Tax=Streptomyces nojiriensis TaxID=66374 RepID=UPI0035E3764B